MKNQNTYLVYISVFIIYTAAGQLSSTFIAAVVDYRPITKVNNGESLAVENAKNFVTFISKAAKHNVDIIIFPDNGLVPNSTDIADASFVPNPMHSTTLCGNRRNKYNRAITMISCAAKMHQLYVIVSHPEKENCPNPNCPPDVDSVVFNTNIVFDRRGIIISRYRKFHWSVQNWDKLSAKAIHSIFETDFKVVFGQITCSDIFSQTPTTELLKFLSLQFAIFSEEPRSNYSRRCSNKRLADWSYENDVTLLRAGYNDPEFSKRGSGIYAGSGGTVHEIQLDEGSNLLTIVELPVYNVTRIPEPNRVYPSIYKFPENEIATSDPVSPVAKVDNNDFITEKIPNVIGEYTVSRCDFGFCCSFRIVRDIDEFLNNNNGSYYRYRILVSRGARPFYGNGYDVGTDVCAIIACTDDTFESCGKVSPSNTPVTESTMFFVLEISYITLTTVESCITSRFATTGMPPRSSHLRDFTKLTQFPNPYTEGVIWNINQFSPSNTSSWFCKARADKWMASEKSNVINLQSSAIYVKKWDIEVTYVGAVVQYEPLTEVPCVKNIKNYVKFIEQANKSNVDIIIFPESGLRNLSLPNTSRASYLPDPSEQVILCRNRTKEYSQELSILSCAARRNNIYVVINYPEKVHCRNILTCSNNEYIFFDTTVVFNRLGELIVRHRNINIVNNSSGAEEINVETAIFTMDSRVPFIIVNCFNIIDRAFVSEVLKLRKISDIIYVDHLDHKAPGDCNAEKLATWSREFNLNVLKSGGRNSGCVMYAGNQGEIEKTSSEDTDILIIAEIPTLSHGERFQRVDFGKLKRYKFYKCITSGVESIFQSDNRVHFESTFNNKSTDPLKFFRYK